MEAGDLFARALPLLLAHADAAGSCGALAKPDVTAPAWRQQVRTRVAVPASLAAALRGVASARDAAAARARLACVCAAARLASDADTPTELRHARAARALACAYVAAMLHAHDLVSAGAPALKRLCVAAEPPPLVDGVHNFQDYDEDYLTWLEDTWPGFLQRVAEAEDGMLSEVVFEELRFSELMELSFTQRHALRGMLASGLFRYTDHMLLSVIGGPHGFVAKGSKMKKAQQEEAEEEEEEVVLEEDDRMLDAFFPGAP